MKYCGRCGKQINSDADVCIYCKTPCNVDVFEQEKKKADGGFAISAIIILIAVLICIGAYCFSEYRFYQNLFNMI